MKSLIVKFKYIVNILTNGFIQRILKFVLHSNILSMDNMFYNLKIFITQSLHRIIANPW